jgi:hypothetical protein
MSDEPSLYDLDFDQFVIDILPVDKRGQNTVGLLQDMLAATQEDHDNLFDSYRSGSSAGAYSALNTYNLNDQVIFRNSVYQSTSNNNNTDPTNTNNWTLVQQNFIGILERITYTSQVIILTYALNKWFGTTFRQPPWPQYSDIYIANAPLVLKGFMVGLTEAVSAEISTVGSSASIGGLTPFGKDFGFAIYIPVEVYNALDPVPANRESIVRSFANLYVIAGVTYQVIPY